MLTLFLGLALAMCTSAQQQTRHPPADQAREARAEPSAGSSVVHGVYTNRQAIRGMQSFQRNCSACHTTREFESPVFWRLWTGRTVGEFIQVISVSMPPENPGTLSPQEYADIMAYLLRLRGHPAGEEELPGDLSVLLKVRIEPPSGGSAGL